MKTNWAIYYLAAMWLAFPACFAPVNSAYEDARLLRKGEVEVQGNFSAYYNTAAIQWEVDELTGITDYNAGFMAAFGLTDRTNLRVRYERLSSRYWVDHRHHFDKTFGLFRVHYFDLCGKWSLAPDQLAIALPLGAYLFPGGVFFAASPRLIYTRRMNEELSLSLIPKFHIWVCESFLGGKPGISLGAAYSTRPDRWSIRPEVGFDGYFYAGLGCSYYLRMGSPLILNE
jgi:hypothetical protein